MVSRFVYRTPLTASYPPAVLLPGLLPLATFGAIVVVSGHRHSHATSGDSRVRGLVPGELVNEHVDGRGFDLLEIEGAVAVALLPKKIVLLRKTPEDDVFDEVIRNLSPMSSRRTRKSSTSAMKSVGSRPDFIDACRRFSRHERRASLVLPSYRAERAAHAATPSAFDPATDRALYFFTVMRAEPSVATKRGLYRRALFRCHVATSVALVSVAAGQVAPSSSSRISTA